MLTFKTAIGIAVQGDDLLLVCLKRGLTGTSESGRTRFANFRAMRPAEAGVAYKDFLRACGLSHANAVVALPRRDVLLRTLSLPIGALSTLDKAIGYQVDALHPFEEGGVDYAYSVLGKNEMQVRVAVVMVEKGIAAGYTDWFAQAGIPIAGFTATAAVLYAANLASAPVFVVSGGELLGISSDALVSREIQKAHLERELQLAEAEMRLPTGTEVAKIEQPDVAHAAALSALGSGAFAINLLPAAKRAYESPWRHAPTYALAAVVILLLAALAGRSVVQDRMYLARVNQEIHSLEPRVKYVEKLETKEGRELSRILTLQRIKGRTPSRLETMAELTRVLPASVSLGEMDLSDDAVTIVGVADSASGLLALLSASPYFKSPEFAGNIAKNNEGKEMFRIRMQLGAAAFKEGRP